MSDLWAILMLILLTIFAVWAHNYENEWHSKFDSQTSDLLECNSQMAYVFNESMVLSSKYNNLKKRIKK